MVLPMTMPLAYGAISLACSGVEMPKLMARGGFGGQPFTLDKTEIKLKFLFALARMNTPLVPAKRLTPFYLYNKTEASTGIL
jgi:hypothetical protein